MRGGKEAIPNPQAVKCTSSSKSSTVVASHIQVCNPPKLNFCTSCKVGVQFRFSPCGHPAAQHHLPKSPFPISHVFTQAGTALGSLFCSTGLPMSHCQCNALTLSCVSMSKSIFLPSSPARMSQLFSALCISIYISELTCQLILTNKNLFSDFDWNYTGL